MFLKINEINMAEFKVGERFILPDDTDGLSNIYLGRCCNGWSINVHGEVLASVFLCSPISTFLIRNRVRYRNGGVNK